jgi:autotransporter-associated beta strand protein
MNKKILFAFIAVLSALSIPNLNAAVQSWNPNGTTSIGGNGTWNTTTKNWTSSTNTGEIQVPSTSLVVWDNTGASAALFCAGPGGSANQGTNVITVNSAIKTGGVYNGQLNPGPGTVTLTGTGSLDISGASGALATFATFNSSLGFTHIQVPITGAAQIQVQSTGQLFLEAANTYSGGTIFNSSASLCNFSNNASFGTGSITLGTTAGPALIALTSGLNIPNDFTFATNGTLNLSATGTTTTTTYSGTWALGTNTIFVGVGGGTGNTAILSGVISGSGGLGRTASTTHGTLKLTASNTYTGKTTIDSSVVSVSSLNKVTGGTASSSLGHPANPANGTIGLGSTSFTGTLLYTGAGETTDRVIDLQGAAGGGIIQNDGTGALIFSSSITASGVGSKTLTLQGANSGANQLVGVVVDNSSANKTTVAKAGAGTWFLSGANTHTGGTSISAGLLNIDNTKALGTGTLTFTGGTNDNTTGADLIVTNAVSLAGTSTYLGAANNISYNGPITLTASRTFNVTAKSVTFNGTLGGAFTFTKGGNGTLNFKVANNHSNTVLSAGFLNINTAAALGTNTFSWNSGSLDNLSGADLTITNAVTFGGNPTYVGSANNLALTANVVINGNRTLTVSNNTVTVTSIGPDATTARNFGKSGNGTLIVTTGCTFTGTTAVNAGTMRFTGASTLMSGVCTNTVTVNGTLDYSSSAGQVLASVVAGTNAIIANGPGEITFTGTNNSFSGTITVNAASGVGVGAVNALPTNSTVNIIGGTLDMANNATVKVLKLAGVIKAAGTYGAVGSGAAHQSSDFTGSGILTVTGGGLSTTTITSDINSSTVGQLVTFTVTVTGTGDGTIPSGTVPLYDNGALVTTLTLTPTTGTSAAATYQTSALALGSHPMSATWAGNTSYSASTGNYTQNVVQPPVITSPTTSSTITTNAGTTLTLTVSVQDSTGVSYLWQKGGANLSNGTHNNAATITGSTAATLTLANLKGADASPGDYTCIASNAAGFVNSGALTLNVIDPAINVQPTNTVIECGSSACLSVTAAGTTNANGVLTYQWYTPNPDGTAVANGTNSTLCFNNVHLGDGGSYSVVVSNAFGNSITSQVAVVSVADTTKPVLVGVPSNVTIDCSQSIPAPATVTATDICDSNPNVVMNAVTNAGNCPQHFSIVRTWIATDASLNSSTNSQTITVVDGTGPVITLTNGPSITVECHAPFVDPGYSATDTCSGSASVSITGNVNVNALGLNTLTYTAADACGNSSTVTRVVNVLDTLAPQLTLLGTSPMNVECHGTFTDPGVTVTEACDPNPTVVPTGSVLVNTPGTYTVTYTATDASGNHSSLTRQVAVVDTTGPDITVLGNSPMTVECHDAFSDPGATALDVCSGSALVSTNGNVDPNTAGLYTLTYSATDTHSNTKTVTRVVQVVDATPPIATINGTSPITLCRNSVYTELGVTATDTCAGTVAITTNGIVNVNAAGNYTVTYTATDASNNSNVVTRVVQIVECAPTITSEPGAVTVNQGNNASFSVSATATAPITYQWSLNGTPLSESAHIIGATSSSLTIVSAEPADVGTYTVATTANTKTSTSDGAATLTLILATPVAITTQPGHLDKQPQGTNVTLSVVATGTAPITYQWFRDGIPLFGQTNATVNDSVQPSAPGTTNVHYSVTVNNPANIAVSSAANPAGQVTILLDGNDPTVNIVSPIKNKSVTAATFVLSGTANDPKNGKAKGNIAHVYYKYVTLNPGSAGIDTNIYEALVTNSAAGASSVTWGGVHAPQYPGTNNLIVWTTDLAGNANMVTNVRQFFYSVPAPVTLNKLGDGTGTFAWKGVWKDKGKVQLGVHVATPPTVLLNVGETYTVTYTPDKNVGVSTVDSTTPTVVSVITNTAEMGTGTNSTAKFVGQPFVMQTDRTSMTFGFDRDRFVDMQGQYNGLFSVAGTPSVDTCGSIQLTLKKTGTMTGNVIIKGVKNNLVPAACDANGTFTMIGTIDPGVTVTGTIAWSDSPNDTAKQIIGHVTKGWSATMLADLSRKDQIAADGAATMAIADCSGIAEAGSAIGTIALSHASGKAKVMFTVPDVTSKVGASGKALSLTLNDTVSGNMPVYAYYADGAASGVIIGFLNGKDANVSTNGAFTWLKTSGGSYYSAGFTNASVNLLMSPYTSGLATANNYALVVGGGGQSDLAFTVDQGLAKQGTLPTNSYTATVSTTGVVKVTYGTGVSHKTWQANGVILQNVNEVRGFLLNTTVSGATASGKLTVDP